MMWKEKARVASGRHDLSVADVQFASLPSGLDTCELTTRTTARCIRVASNTHDRPCDVYARFLNRARIAAPGNHAFADCSGNAHAPLPRVRRDVQRLLPGARCCRGDTELGASARTLQWATTRSSGSASACAERDRALDADRGDPPGDRLRHEVLGRLFAPCRSDVGRGNACAAGAGRAVSPRDDAAAAERSEEHARRGLRRLHGSEPDARRPHHAQFALARHDGARLLRRSRTRSAGSLRQHAPAWCDVRHLRGGSAQADRCDLRRSPGAPGAASDGARGGASQHHGFHLLPAGSLRARPSAGSHGRTARHAGGVDVRDAVLRVRRPGEAHYGRGVCVRDTDDCGANHGGHRARHQIHLGSSSVAMVSMARKSWSTSSAR
jgi:hypothetical protein